MAKLLYTRFYCLCIIMTVTTLSANAGNGTVQPKQFNLNAFIRASVQVFNGNAVKAETFPEQLKSKTANTVCVCEIMQLRNNNVQISNVAVFAEKTNKGNMGDGYKMAERMISRERKQMKQVYFDAVKTNARMAVATNCLTLYMKLKETTPELKLYDILDANSK
ncbi:hypothetical protein [Agriterribacter sp.]|uniref:hypothetical protein n=1 Tax=Agriterribacter sp. TaxID=2821509 RepID=UPI002D19A3DA|nr:hypothetical protein [Agriterribacter sp.]HRO45510.1 hypothetical protein [Agriterribacter sp.]HRQ19549.1 hypothetical protein [Agriterribacter sp.]